MKGRMPADYQPPPPMDEVVEFYVKAFFQISRSRPYYEGGTPGYLSLSSIADYVNVFGEPYDIEQFIEVIFAMDMEYIPVVLRKQKSKVKSPSRGESRPALPPPAKGR